MMRATLQFSYENGLVPHENTVFQPGERLRFAASTRRCAYGRSAGQLANDGC